MTFAEKLRALRKQADMSQEKLAEKLSVSRQEITKWENHQWQDPAQQAVMIDIKRHPIHSGDGAL